MIHQKGKNGHLFSQFWFEPLLLFAVLYLPGYISQTPEYNKGLFDSLFFNILYVVITIPQILFILYLLWKRGPEAWSRYGIKPLTAGDIPRALLILVTVYVVVAPLMVLMRQIAPGGAEALPVQPGWTVSRPAMLPVIFCTCLLTGYSEELYFRAYLLTILEDQGFRPALSITATVLLFGAGHFYQGFESFLGTVVIGILLALFFLKYRNLHRIGIAHGLYNFCVLLLSLFFPVGA